MKPIAPITLSELISRVDALSRSRLDMKTGGAAADPTVGRFMPPDAAGPGDIAFLTDPKYAAAMKTTKASVVVIREKDVAGVWGEEAPSQTLVLTSNPYAFFAYASQVFFPVKREPGVRPGAVVEAGAEVDPTATIESNAVVKAGAKIGARVVVGAGSVIGEDAVVGEDTVIHPNVVLGFETQVGRRCVLQPGCVIGGDGFGFAPFLGEWVKIPQIGRVVLGDDVEVGANTTIDRGALEDTVVGEGTKLDNQIQLGHNDRIGRHCVMAACVGIAGSTEVGDHTMVGGAAMVNGHIKIPAGSAIGPATAITGWGPEACQRTGFFPAMEGKEFQLTAAMVARLPAMRREVKALERRIAELETLIRKGEA